MKWSFKSKWIFVLLLLVIVGLWFITRQSPNSELPLVESKRPNQTGNYWEAENLGVIKPTESQSSEGAFPEGATIAQFANASEYTQFLNRAEKFGIKILDTIPSLRAIRISTTDARKLSEEEGMIWEINGIVRVPESPDNNEINERLYPVGNRALYLMGLERDIDRSSWGDGINIAVLDTPLSNPFASAYAQVKLIDGNNPQNPLNGIPSHADLVISLILDEVSGISPKSSVMSLSVLDDSGKGTVFDLANGIITAVDSGAQIINMSLGMEEPSEFLRSAIKYAADRNVVLIAAVGNDANSPVMYPAAFSDVIAVTASDGLERAPQFTNKGSAIDLAAPGVGLAISSPDGTTTYFTGTSASAPLVSGAVARLLQNDSALSPKEVAEKLRLNSNDRGDAGKDPSYGSGILALDRLFRDESIPFYDLAIADFAFPSATSAAQDLFEVRVVVQNQGNRFIPNGSISAEVNGQPYTFVIGGLNIGEVEEFPIFVTEGQLRSGESLSFEAKATLGSGLSDDNLTNNIEQISIGLKGN